MWRRPSLSMCRKDERLDLHRRCFIIRITRRWTSTGRWRTEPTTSRKCQPLCPPPSRRRLAATTADPAIITTLLLLRQQTTLAPSPCLIPAKYLLYRHPADRVDGISTDLNTSANPLHRLRSSRTQHLAQERWGHPSSTPHSTSFTANQPGHAWTPQRRKCRALMASLRLHRSLRRPRPRCRLRTRTTRSHLHLPPPASHQDHTRPATRRDLRRTGNSHPSNHHREPCTDKKAPALPHRAS